MEGRSNTSPVPDQRATMSRTGCTRHESRALFGSCPRGAIRQFLIDEAVPARRPLQRMPARRHNLSPQQGLADRRRRVTGSASCLQKPSAHTHEL
jgi:hypothetical protein